MFRTIKLVPRFTPLPTFNPALTKAQRIAQHLAASDKGYQFAVRETDREFKVYAKAHADALKAKVASAS